jgi:hypothetical protein
MPPRKQTTLQRHVLLTNCAREALLTCADAEGTDAIVIVVCGDGSRAELACVGKDATPDPLRLIRACVTAVDRLLQNDLKGDQH